MYPELISHPLCPYCQRGVLTLLKKGQRRGQDFAVTYVDLGNLPAWFLTLSPKRDMPVLRPLADEAPLFKALAITAYLDETTPGSLLPAADALRRARDRQWLVYAATPLDLLRDVYTARDPEKLAQNLTKVFEALHPLEAVLEDRPAYFRQHTFSAVDAAYAPLFMLLRHFAVLRDDPRWEALPRTRHWAESLLADADVQASATPNYAGEFAHFFAVTQSYFPQFVAAAAAV